MTKLGRVPETSREDAALDVAVHAALTVFADFRGMIRAAIIAYQGATGEAPAPPDENERTFSVRLSKMPCATWDMAERELGAIVSDALEGSRHIHGYRIEAVGAVPLPSDPAPARVTAEHLAYLLEHLFIGIREDENTNERPVEIRFRTWLSNDELTQAPNHLLAALDAAIGEDEDWYDREDRAELIAEWGPSGSPQEPQ